MFGSSILDVAIGLVFVYLLLSLIVTAASEMIASWLKRRHDNLWQGMVQLLGEDQAKLLYRHPLIKVLSPPRLLDRSKVESVVAAFFQRLLGKASGPSYIPARTFAVSLLDSIKFQPASDLANQLRRVLATFPETAADARTLKKVLLAAANSSLAGGGDAVREFQAFLLTMPDTAAFNNASQQLKAFLDANPGKFAGLRSVVGALLGNASLPTLSAREVKDAVVQALGSPANGGELLTLLQHIPDSASPAVVKQEVLEFLDKSLLDPLGALPHELRETNLGKSLALLWNEADHDVERFKEKIETWFNDAMDRVSGWYKRKTQLVNTLLAVVFTLALNVDTILIVNTLTKNPALRDSVVAQASRFAEQTPIQVQLPASSNPFSSTNGPFAFFLSTGAVVSGENLEGIITLNDANSNDLVFALSTSAASLASVQSNITVLRGQKSTNFTITTHPLPNSGRVDIGASNRMAVLQLLPNPQEKFRVAKTQLEELELPIGWIFETTINATTPNATNAADIGKANNANAADRQTTASATAFGDRKHQLCLVLVPYRDPSFWARIGRAASFHWLGWLLTAMAVSLGAPFWFDLLNKFITIRSSGKAPEEKPKSPK